MALGTSCKLTLKKEITLVCVIPSCFTPLTTLIQVTPQVDHSKSNYISRCKRFRLFYIKSLFFLFYTISFTKYPHQFIYYTHFFIKIIFSLNFFIISHLTLLFPLNTPLSSSHNPYLYLRLSFFSIFFFFF